MFDYDNEINASEEKIAGATDEKLLEVFRIEYLGKKGMIAAMYANLGELPNDQKPEEGKKINEFRAIVTQLIEEKKKELNARKRRATQKTLDVTIPGVAQQSGRDRKSVV